MECLRWRAAEKSSRMGLVVIAVWCVVPMLTVWGRRGGVQGGMGGGARLCARGWWLGEI